MFLAILVKTGRNSTDFRRISMELYWRGSSCLEILLQCLFPEHSSHPHALKWWENLVNWYRTIWEVSSYFWNYSHTRANVAVFIRPPTLRCESTSQLVLLWWILTHRSLFISYLCLLTSLVLSVLVCIGQVYAIHDVKIIFFLTFLLIKRYWSA